MGLEIQKKKDGTLKSKWWYGRFEAGGKTKCLNLGIEIKGRVPETLRQPGDVPFERKPGSKPGKPGSVKAGVSPIISSFLTA